MSTASLSDGVGPGSSISLAPETIRVRNALIEKFSGSSLEEMQSFMTLALSKETDEFRRLGILAARIFLLRNRIAKLKEFNRDPKLPQLPALDLATLSLSLPVSGPATSDDEPVEAETESWSRIQMTEPGEVNGVRILSGTIIDAQTADAQKLINSGKAVRVDEEGNIIEQEEETSENSTDDVETDEVDSTETDEVDSTETDEVDSTETDNIDTKIADNLDEPVTSENQNESTSVEEASVNTQPNEEPETNKKIENDEDTAAPDHDTILETEKDAETSST